MHSLLAYGNLAISVAESAGVSPSNILFLMGGEMEMRLMSQFWMLNFHFHFHFHFFPFFGIEWLTSFPELIMKIDLWNAVFLMVVWPAIGHLSHRA
jgi:hypothetical protein